MWGRRQDSADVTGEAATGSFMGTRPRRNAVGWTGVGFVAGLLFWNLVGFVPGAGLVLRDWPPSSGITTASIEGEKRPEKVPGSEAARADVRSAGVNCVTLALDRRDQMTRALPCDHHHDLHHSAVSDREDFARLDPDFAADIARAIEQVVED